LLVRVGVNLTLVGVTAIRPADPETAASLGMPGLVAQGVQVAGPAYGMLLDIQHLTDKSPYAMAITKMALNRGLDVLTELNRLERAAINTLAAAVGLPRTTTYRILETLRLAGYVDRDSHDDCYRPTIMVRALSDGFDDEALVAHIAKALGGTSAENPS